MAARAAVRLAQCFPDGSVPDMLELPCDFPVTWMQIRSAWQGCASGARSEAAFAEMVMRYCDAGVGPGSGFAGVRRLLLDYPETRDTFLSQTVPFIIDQASRLPDRVAAAGRVPMLKSDGRIQQLSLDRLLVLSLLANAFLLSMAPRYDRMPLVGVQRGGAAPIGGYDASLTDPRFLRLFHATTAADVAKLRMYVHYFDRAAIALPHGRITVYRTRAAQRDPSTSATPLLPLLVADGPVGLGGRECIRAVAACRHAGGGVLSSDGTCEEVRFAACPENTVVAMLCPNLRDEEALQIVGGEQFSTCSGYADLGPGPSPHLAFMGGHRDVSGRAPDGTVRQAVAVMDPLDFSCAGAMNLEEQLDPQLMLREFTKASAAFAVRDELVQDLPIASGNWGGGSLRGCTELKALLQWAAASEARKKLIYVPGAQESQTSFSADLQGLSVNLTQPPKGATVGDLWRALLELRTPNTDPANSTSPGRLFAVVLGIIHGGSPTRLRTSTPLPRVPEQVVAYAPPPHGGAAYQVSLEELERQSVYVADESAVIAAGQPPGLVGGVSYRRRTNPQGDLLPDSTYLPWGESVHGVHVELPSGSFVQVGDRFLALKHNGVPVLLRQEGLAEALGVAVGDVVMVWKPSLNLDLQAIVLGFSTAGVRVNFTAGGTTTIPPWEARQHVRRFGKPKVAPKLPRATRALEDFTASSPRQPLSIETWRKERIATSPNVAAAPSSVPETCFSPRSLMRALSNDGPLSLRLDAPFDAETISSGRGSNVERGSSKRGAQLALQRKLANAFKPRTPPSSKPPLHGILKDFTSDVAALELMKVRMPVVSGSNLPPLPALGGEPGKFVGPHDTCNYVLPGRLIAGSFPGARTEPDHSRKLSRVLEAEMDTFICLLTAPELEGFLPYVSLGRQIAHRQSVKRSPRPMQFLHCAMEEDGACVSTNLDAAITTIIDRLSMRRNVYVHCWGGHGRTGTLICAFLVKAYGLTAPQAAGYFNAVHKARPMQGGGGPSLWPQTEEQLQQVQRVERQRPGLSSDRLPPLEDWDVPTLADEKPPTGSGIWIQGRGVVALAPPPVVLVSPPSVVLASPSQVAQQLTLGPNLGGSVRVQRSVTSQPPTPAMQQVVAAWPTQAGAARSASHGQALASVRRV